MDKKNMHRLIEVGDWRDTYTAIMVAQGFIKRGMYEMGVSLLYEIRDHIDQSDENQNLRPLLPLVYASIAYAKIAYANELEKAKSLVASAGQEGTWGRMDDGSGNG